MLYADVYTVWIFLAALAYLTLLLVKRSDRLPATTPYELPPVDLQDQLSAKVLQLERLIADGQQQLARTQELVSQLDRAA